MSESIRRCHRCMNEIGEGHSCPNCGYINGDKEYNKDYLAPDTILNQRYIIGNLLRFNNESAVYIAFDKNLESVVEVKEYMPAAIAKRNLDNQKIELEDENVELYKKLAKEFLNLNQGLSKIRTISSLVQIYDIFPENNTCYAIMESVQGMNLNEYLLDNLGELSWDRASDLILPVIKHLEKLHELGFVHGGLSPETIFITDKGQMKIGGFCISSLRQQGGELPAELHDGYAAPEQYEPEQSIGPWTDIYGIAATLYKILTGTKPSDAKSRGSVDNLLQPNALNATVPNHISVSIMSSMSLQFRLRTQTMHDLYTDLSTAPRQNSIIDNNDENEDEEKNPTSSRKYIFVAMGITLPILILISALILWFIFGNNDNSDNQSELNLASSNISAMVPSTLNYASSGSDNTESSNSGNDVLLMYNLIRKSISVVQSDSHYSSISVTVESEDYNEEYGEGIIYYQSIDAGTEISEGQAVKVKVSKGSAYKAVPKYEGLSIGQYLVALQDAGIVNYEIVYKSDSNYEHNYVISTSVEQGSNIHVDSTLTVYVAQD